MKEKEKYDVIVIGGGPAGMMAAGIAAQNGKSVLLIEKNKELGKKLKRTGGGRCNITYYELDNRKLLPHYGKAEQFLYSPFSQFSVKETFTFFEKKKLPLVVQARKRVFPKSERAEDVLLVLKNFLKKEKVKILLHEEVIKIHAKENEIVYIETNKRKKYFAKSFILATGGLSAPETGSTGDGFQWLKKLGHTIHKPSPDIVPLKIKESWIPKLSGISFSFMKITFFVNEKRMFSKKGKILFTHFGISSPTILNLARKVRYLLEKGVVKAEVDLFPDTEKNILEKRILKLFQNTKNKNIKNALQSIIPKKMVEVILQLSGIPETKKVHSITIGERKKIRDLLKGIPFHITGLMGMDRAVIADGGVPLNEINMKEMRSKKIKNLFLVGDILHITRPSGGFSLQLCWTTGFVAGKNA